MISRILLCGVCMLALPVAAAPLKSWAFKVYLDDVMVGHHRFELLQRNGEQEVRSRARFEVKMLFITVYSYRHDSRERWRGNCLQSLDATTDDNGEKLRVRAQALNGRLRVEVNGRSTDYPTPCTMSFAYWNPAFLSATRLLNPQTGELVDVRIERSGAELLKVGNRTVSSRRYTLRAPQMRIELFYSESGQWLALDAPTENGRMLRYRMDRLPGCDDNAPGRTQQEVCT
ncbi:MAG: DUF6134 family protein [Gammaproteobacteria bacterium]